jgi:hypothetical protein
MTWDEYTAEIFLASQIDWESQPSLSTEQKDLLMTLAQATDAPTYTIESIGAAIYLGLSWRLAQAAQTVTRDGENVIFEQIYKLLSRWAAYADPLLGGTVPDALQLIDLEVGRNFESVEV